jgi:hypothetical protein
MSTTTKVLIGLVIVAALACLAAVMRRAHLYNDFIARRHAWHLRCDRYRELPATFWLHNPPPAAVACNQDLNAMADEARAHGWMK